MLVPTETLATPDISAKLVNATLEPVAFQTSQNAKVLELALGGHPVRFYKGAVESMTETRWGAHVNIILNVLLQCAQKWSTLRVVHIAKTMVIVHLADVLNGWDPDQIDTVWAPWENLAMVQMEQLLCRLENIATGILQL
jgi:hypothetical protein